jgi:Na+-translocating ferredoxin:NAD+ oxidoreductase RnfG subunit
MKKIVIFMITALAIFTGCGSSGGGSSKEDEENKIKLIAESEIKTNKEITSNVLKAVLEKDGKEIELKFEDSVKENVGTENEKICISQSVAFRVAQLATQAWSDGVFRSYEISKIRTGWSTEGIYEFFSNDETGKMKISRDKLLIEGKNGGSATDVKNLTVNDCWYEITFTNGAVLTFTATEGENGVFTTNFLPLRIKQQNGDTTVKTELAAERVKVESNLKNVPFNRINMAKGKNNSIVIPKAVPTYPAQDAADISTITDIIIKWNYSVAVAGYTFDIYTGESADKLTLFSSVTGKKQLTVTKLTFESNKKYYWKVVTKDTNGNSSESDTYSFATKKLSTNYSIVTTMVKAKDTKAAYVEEETYDKTLSKIYDSGYNIIGYYLTTTPYGDDIRGYAGPCPVLVTANIDKKITSVELMTGLAIYKETPSYIQRMTDAGFFRKWNGTDIKTSGELNVDTVAGSTLTSRAVINNIKRRVALLKE